VPGGIYSDLLEAGIVRYGDVYWFLNDIETRWIGNDSWTFSRDFTGLWNNLSRMVVRHAISIA